MLPYQIYNQHVLTKLRKTALACPSLVPAGFMRYSRKYKKSSSSHAAWQGLKQYKENERGSRVFAFSQMHVPGKLITLLADCFFNTMQWTFHVCWAYSVIITSHNAVWLPRMQCYFLTMHFLFPSTDPHRSVTWPWANKFHQSVNQGFSQDEKVRSPKNILGPKK